eukprot:1157389-Pelagomonas_calceolata.AAC.9
MARCGVRRRGDTDENRMPRVEAWWKALHISVLPPNTKRVIESCEQNANGDEMATPLLWHAQVVYVCARAHEAKDCNACMVARGMQEYYGYLPLATCTRLCMLARGENEKQTTLPPPHCAYQTPLGLQCLRGGQRHATALWPPATGHLRTSMYACLRKK